MATKSYTIGLSKIEVGAIAADGGMGTSLEQLGYTYQDTCQLTQEDAEKTEFYAEEVEDPVVEISRAGKVTFAFSVMNPSVKVLSELLGGTYTEADPDTSGSMDKWEAPDSLPVIEKSVRIVPSQGLTFEIPRMKIDAKISSTFSKSGVLVIEVSGTVLQPTKEGEKKMTAKLTSTTVA